MIIFEDIKSVGEDRLMGKKRYDAYVKIQKRNVPLGYELSVRDFNGVEGAFMLDDKKSLESMIKVLEGIKDEL